MMMMEKVAPDPESEIYNISPGEWAVIIIGIIFHSVNLCGLGYVFYNRNYPPLKIQQIEIVACNLISSILWWIGAMAVLRVLPQVNDPVFLVCNLWAFWVQLVFGLWLWVCTLIFRLWKLYVIVKLKRSASGYGFYASFLIFWGPGLIFGMLASIFKANGPLDYEGYYQCRVIAPAVGVAFAFEGVYALVTIFLIISLRSVPQTHFFEYQKMRNMLGVLLILGMGYLIIVALSFQKMLWGRCLATIIVVLCGTFSFWFIVGVPVYHCLFHHDKMLKQFHINFLNASTSTGDQKIEEIEMT